MATALHRLLLAGLLIAAGCSRTKQPLLEDLAHQTDLSRATIQELAGHRDGDRLQARLVVGDTSSSFTAVLRFHIGAPTTLVEGTWWKGGPGIAPPVQPVTAKSVTFLGGQDGPPSIGGTFELLDGSGAVQYRIHLPTTPLKARD